MIYLVGVSKDTSYSKIKILKLKLRDLKDGDKISRIEKETRNFGPEGLYELFDELASKGNCSSYNESRIYYVAYLLAERDVFVEIERV